MSELLNSVSLPEQIKKIEPYHRLFQGLVAILANHKMGVDVKKIMNLD